MITWLMNVFSERTDQARLVTVIISALVALTIVYTNHYLAKLREKKTFDISKVEELYTIIIQIDQVLSKLRKAVQYLGGLPVSKNSKLLVECQSDIDELRKILPTAEMLCRLYFKELVPDIIVETYPTEGPTQLRIGYFLDHFDHIKNKKNDFTADDIGELFRTLTDSEKFTKIVREKCVQRLNKLR